MTEAKCLIARCLGGFCHEIIGGLNGALSLIGGPNFYFEGLNFLRKGDNLFGNLCFFPLMGFKFP